MQSLKDHLKTDEGDDVVIYHLAKLLGVIPEDENFDLFRKHKEEWCSRTPLNDALTSVLNTMEKEGFITWNGRAFQWTSTHSIE